ncbi:MAG: hypothetical protein QGH20_05030 [Candidatus Latescibacteria bacterium]|nr:hypothetical protein [Candidatus Latescibacterota bacterium]
MADRIGDEFTAALQKICVRHEMPILGQRVRLQHLVQNSWIDPFGIFWVIVSW